MWPPGLSRLSPRQLDGAPGAPLLARGDFPAGGLLFFVYALPPHTGTWPNFPASAEAAGGLLFRSWSLAVVGCWGAFAPVYVFSC